METVIKNSNITLTVADHGAEAVSLKKGDTEYLWNGDAAFWNRHAPVLFPFVGMVWDKKFRYDGQEYTIGQHGFARDQEFELVSKTDDKLSYVLKSNETTRALYPFDFNFYVEYELQEDGVKVIWRVVNTDSKDLHFSVGGHPAFLCPIEEGKDWEDYRVSFKKNGKALDSISSHVITEGGCFGEGYMDVQLENGLVTPTDKLFSTDALVLEDGQSDEIALTDAEGNAYLTVTFDTPVVGVWSPVGKHAPFICIEPWYGRADRVGFAGSLEEREYANVLAPGKTWEGGCTVKV